MSGQKLGRVSSSPSSSPSSTHSSKVEESYAAEASSPSLEATQTTDAPRGASQDPQRLKHLETIDSLRSELQVRSDLSVCGEFVQ